MICHWQEQLNTLRHLRLSRRDGRLWLHPGFAKQGTDEAQNRLENIQELYNAVQQFEEDNQDPTLSSDLDDMKREHASLMTLHARLEFPVVFLVGLEQGLLPHSRT